MGRFIAVILVGVLCLGSGVAWAAGENSPQLTPIQLDLAKKHFEDGKRLYREKQYDLARIEFEACLAITKNADLLHNLSEVAERQGQIADAIVYEETFLDQKRGELEQSELDQTAGRIARLREKLNQASAAPATPAKSETPREPTQDRRRPSGVAIGLLVGGGVSLLIGIGCGAGAYTTARSLESGEPLTMGDFDALTARGQALDRAGIALDVIGGVALAAGTVWAIVERSRRPTAAPRVAKAPVTLVLGW